MPITKVYNPIKVYKRKKYVKMKKTGLKQRFN